MAISWGGLAGGLSEGIESGQRMRLARQREARAQEEFGLRRRRFEREEAQLDRDAQMWEELNGVIAKHSQKRAAAQTPTAVRPPQAEDLSGGAVATPVQNPAEGMQVRELGPNEPAPGLDRAAPAQAPAPAAAAAPQAEPTQKIGFELFRNTHLLRDTEFLNEAAQVFIKARKPEGIKWLERGFQAQQQNGIDALRALMTGDRQRALQLLNMSGQNVQDIRPITEGPDRGKWMVVAPSGQSRVLDPGQELKTFLDPEQFFEMQNKERDDARAERKTDAEIEKARAQTGVFKAQEEFYRGARTTQAEAAAAAARARAAQPQRQPESKESVDRAHQFADSHIQRLSVAVDESGRQMIDPDSQKPVVDQVKQNRLYQLYNDAQLEIESALGRELTSREIRMLGQRMATAPINDDAKRPAWMRGTVAAIAGRPSAGGRAQPAASAKRKPPPGVPADSVPVGRAKAGPDKGKIVWRAPDGKQYVGDEE